MSGAEFADHVLEGLVRSGHFVYESGHHGDEWLELEPLISQPERLRTLALGLAEKLRGFRAEVVCGPLEGGAFVAQWVAHALGARFAYARRDPGESAAAASRYVVSNAFELAGKKAIMVDDAINVGSATIACVQELAARGCEVVALASVFVCAPAGEQVGALLQIPQLHVFSVPTQLWDAGECPMCRLRASG